jgi:hypothetical protein
MSGFALKCQVLDFSVLTLFRAELSAFSDPRMIH